MDNFDSLTIFYRKYNNQLNVKCARKVVQRKAKRKTPGEY